MSETVVGSEVKADEDGTTVAEAEGVGVWISYHDGEHLEFGDEIAGLGDVLRGAGLTPLDLGEALAFEHHGPAPAVAALEPYQAEKVAAYRARSGRAFPPVARVVLRAEVTPLSDAEAADYWRAQAARSAARDAAIKAERAAAGEPVEEDEGDG